MTTRRPRVLQVVLSLNPGGTERLVLDLVTALEHEMAMAVCCLDEAGAWAPVLTHRGVPVEPLGRQAGFHPALGRRIARIARHHRTEVIHAHHYSPFVYSALARLWAPGLRLVFTEHGRLSDAPPSSRRRLANPLLGVAPHRVFAVSRDVAAHLVGEGFRAASVGVIYNGIDPADVPTAAARARVRRDLGAADTDVVLATIARVDPVKDLDTLVAAAAALVPRYPIRLVVVGDGPGRAALEAGVAARGLSDRIHLIGYRDDAREWLAGADIYVNSSVSEGVSLTILEAMAAALPVVATAVGGTPEVVDETCGRLVPARDPAALSRALETLIVDPGAREALGRAGRTRVETRFTIARMVDDYATVYRSLTSSGPEDPARGR